MNAYYVCRGVYRGECGVQLQLTDTCASSHDSTDIPQIASHLHAQPAPEINPVIVAGVFVFISEHTMTDSLNANVWCKISILCCDV